MCFLLRKLSHLLFQCGQTRVRLLRLPQLVAQAQDSAGGAETKPVVIITEQVPQNNRSLGRTLTQMAESAFKNIGASLADLGAEGEILQPAVNRHIGNAR